MERLIEAFPLLVLPFAACVVIASLHCYLGLHVIKRGVIFVDLALAQCAALGAAVALLVGPYIGQPAHRHTVPPNATVVDETHLGEQLELEDDALLQEPETHDHIQGEVQKEQVLIKLCVE